jgi:glucan phosphoethanolaminetransferase (alkaline phosphatase superfamily)
MHLPLLPLLLDTDASSRPRETPSREGALAVLAWYCDCFSTFSAIIHPTLLASLMLQGTFNLPYHLIPVFIFLVSYNIISSILRPVSFVLSTCLSATSIRNGDPLPVQNILLEAPIGFSPF